MPHAAVAWCLGDASERWQQAVAAAAPPTTAPEARVSRGTAASASKLSVAPSCGSCETAPALGQDSIAATATATATAAPPAPGGGGREALLPTVCVHRLQVSQVHCCVGKKVYTFPLAADS